MSATVIKQRNQLKSSVRVLDALAKRLIKKEKKEEAAKKKKAAKK
jgi:hypothetical protein